MIDVETGEVIKSVPEDYSFIPKVFIGESCYGMVVREKTGSGYISTEDFWNGKFENAIQFKLD
ncbi:MAG: hypothetical protein J6T47_00520 [Lachnospiraceae bacterium]|nr:hypothetical protein [Lachnospiraceae bacterium]MBR6366464.1 hypothetical protein [Lachnospiraceae bacterium]